MTARGECISPKNQFYILTIILFIVYLCVAIPISILPVYISDQLRLTNVWAGFAVGASFLTTLLSRGWGGQQADQKGAKYAVIRGLILYTVGGLVCALSTVFTVMPVMAYLCLIAGRFIIGVGESLAAVGIIAWGIAFVGPQQSGKVMAFVGAAMYGALAVGGPLGLFIFNHSSFLFTMVISTLLPILGLLAIAPLTDTNPEVDNHAEHHSFASVIHKIWRHGLVVGLQGIGFSAIGAFFVLYFLHQGWQNAGLGLTAFGGGFVLMRLLFGNLPDKMGGLKVALVSLIIETIGQLLIWTSGSPEVAFAGAFMTGLGCSMVYPSMGREVVQLVPAEMRGTALGGYGAFQDLSYGLTGPVAGILADYFGYNVTFLAGGIAALGGLLMTCSLLKRMQLTERLV